MHFVDLQRDATVADVCAGDRRRTALASSTSSATPPIGTGARPGPDLGRQRVGVIAAALGGPASRELGTTTFRPPYMPVAFAALAGRDRGDLFDPVRTTPIARLARRARRRVRERRPVEAPVVLPASRARTWTRRSLRECRAARDGRRR